MTEPRRWVLEFNGRLPPSPNDRLHWAERMRIMKTWKTRAHFEAKFVAKIPPLDKIKVSIVVQRTVIGRADEDNDRARAKPLIDGIVTSGVVKDDTRAYVQWGTCEERKGKRAIIVIVEEVLGGN